MVTVASGWLAEAPMAPKLLLLRLLLLLPQLLKPELLLLRLLLVLPQLLRLLLLLPQLLSLLLLLPQLHSLTSQLLCRTVRMSSIPSAHGEGVLSTCAHML